MILIRSPATSAQATQILADKGKSFYWASHFLGKKYLSRATQLYGFCRYLDDLVDEEELQELAKQKIIAARQDIAKGISDHPILNDGIALLGYCHVPQDIVFDLIMGIESDTELVRVANKRDLLHYCYQVAGTVGLMMCGALDVTDPAARPYAIDLGIAMQLTNICRDIKADGLVNRRYIPADLIENIEVSFLINPNEEQAKVIQNAVAKLLQLADTYYQSGERGLSYLPLRARFSIFIAVRIYHGIGNQLKSENYEYWHARIIVSATRKFVITILTLGSICLNRHFWFHPKKHDARQQKYLLNATSHSEFY